MEETRSCQNCKTSFVIEPDDFGFYEKMGVPAPTFCQECRLQRRMAWRNERFLYKRNCDMCGESKILQFSQASPFKVFCRECWWSDTWEGTDAGREYDFSRSFFEQFRELAKDIPRVGNIKQGNIVDSEYTNRVSDLRNCYLLYGSFSSENCSYGSWVNDSTECMDCYGIQKSEKCYECIDCFSCYNTSFSQESMACSNSSYLFNCRNCESCFGCVNLRSKNYCIFNQQYTKEDYAKKIAEMKLDSWNHLQKVEQAFSDYKKEQLYPYMIQSKCDAVSGNWIEQCKNVISSFCCKNVEDGKYLFSVMNAKDSMDHTFWGRETELVYDAINIGRQCSSVMFSSECWDGNTGLSYCINCHGSSNLFGCVGLKKKEYCILNKQYTKEEYVKLVPEIIAQMKNVPFINSKGHAYAYGEFFPPEMSFFGYNETVAQEFFQKSKTDTENASFNWKDPEEKNYSHTVASASLPDSVYDVVVDIAKETIECACGGMCNHQCTKAFRVLENDLAKYSAMNFPLPRFCPNCRHYKRLEKRNPLHLWSRRCACDNAGHDHSGNCQNEFETSYAPDRQEIVYCESCYQKEIL